MCQDVLEYVSMYYKKVYEVYICAAGSRGTVYKSRLFYVLILAMRCFADSSMEVKNVHPTKFLLYPKEISFVSPRETREGWPLLTVETDVNGDSKSTNEKVSFHGWFVRLIVPLQLIFVLPWLL